MTDHHFSKTFDIKISFQDFRTKRLIKYLHGKHNCCGSQDPCMDPDSATYMDPKKMLVDLWVAWPSPQHWTQTLGSLLCTVGLENPSTFADMTVSVSSIVRRAPKSPESHWSGGAWDARRWMHHWCSCIIVSFSTIGIVPVSRCCCCHVRSLHSLSKLQLGVRFRQQPCPFSK